MSATIRQIKDDALALVGEIAGSGVATFTEDRMMAEVIRSFNLLFKKYHWPQYQKWYRIQLDGVLGVSTTDAFEDIVDFEDFICIMRDTSSVPLPIKPSGMNPYALANVGTAVRYWTSLHVSDANYAKRKLQFYPVTSIEFVNVCAKPYPVSSPLTRSWDWDDYMYLDKDMLVYGTAFMSLVNDDINASAAKTAQALMEMKYRDIIAKLGDHPIAIGPQMSIPVDWFTAP